MTGWRLGWLVLPPALVPVAERLAQNLFICASTIAQHAALACFEPESLAEYERRRAAFKARRDYFIPELNRLGLSVPVMPDGAFYAWADVSALCERWGLPPATADRPEGGSWALAFELMQRCQLATTPGRDFGQADSRALPALLHRQQHGAAARSDCPAGGRPVTAPDTVTGSVGATERSAGPPQASSTPPGGSEPRAAGSVGATFTWPVRVYWEDTDAGGIVFYANYLKFFERARTEWLRSLGIEQQRLRDQTGGMFVVTETQLRYMRPARLDDLLLVTAHVQEAGRASLTMVQRVLLKPEHGGDANIVLCEGTIRIGWVDGAAMRPQRIPAEVLRQIAPVAP